MIRQVARMLYFLLRVPDAPGTVRIEIEAPEPAAATPLPQIREVSDSKDSRRFHQAHENGGDRAGRRSFGKRSGEISHRPSDAVGMSVPVRAGRFKTPRHEY